MDTPEVKKDPRLQPGAHAENAKLTECKPCGKCHGVLFLGSKVVKVDQLANGQLQEYRDDGYERQALQYVKPMPVDWLALHPGQVGVCKPNMESIFPLPIWREAEEAGRPLCWIFASEDKCINGIQPEHRLHWKFEKVEEGVWAVLYV